MSRWWKWAAACTGSVMLLTACGGGHDDEPAVVAPQENLAQVAQSAGFTALVAAAQKAGLVEALSDANVQWTVFAPTDEAFTAFASTLGFPSAGALVDALPAEALAQVLTYHVLPQRLAAQDLVASGGAQATLYSFEGAPASLGLDTGNGVTLTDAVLTTASVTTADVGASNGIIHVIDKVLVPPGVLNLVQMAQLNPAFSSLVGAVVAADLATTLSSPGPFTVFAPIDDAFAAIAGTVAGLTTQQLASVLLYHVVPAQVLAADIQSGSPVTTALAGQTFTINTSASGATIVDTTATPARIVATDVRASNGVIHVIDKVLLPAL